MQVVIRDGVREPVLPDWLKRSVNKNPNVHKLFHQAVLAGFTREQLFESLARAGWEMVEAQRSRIVELEMNRKIVVELPPNTDIPL